MNISIQALSPSYLNSTTCLESDVWNNHLTFEKGTRYLIDAPSGKGKSTFIQTLYGIQRNHPGEVFYGQKSLTSFNKEELALLRQKKLAIVFQDLRLFPEISAIENVQLNTNLSQNSQFNTIDDLFERLNISSLKHRVTKTLSYGEKQRVAIIRAIAQQFDWIILDEPYAHLDEHNTRCAHELIQEVAQSLHAGVILTSLGTNDLIEFDHKL